MKFTGVILLSIVLYYQVVNCADSMCNDVTKQVCSSMVPRQVSCSCIRGGIESCIQGQSQNGGGTCEEDIKTECTDFCTKGGSSCDAFQCNNVGVN
jgi:hypothetical protein